MWPPPPPVAPVPVHFLVVVVFQQGHNSVSARAFCFCYFLFGTFLFSSFLSLSFTCFKRRAFGVMRFIIRCCTEESSRKVCRTVSPSTASSQQWKYTVVSIEAPTRRLIAYSVSSSTIFCVSSMPALCPATTTTTGHTLVWVLSNQQHQPVIFTFSVWQ